MYTTELDLQYYYTNNKLYLFRALTAHQEGVK